MTALSNVSKVIIVAIAVAIVIVLIIVYTTGNANPTNVAQNASGHGATLIADSPTQIVQATGSISQSVTQKKNTSPPSITPSPVGFIIHIITPVKNDVWKIGTQEPISWDNAGNISGSISLLDAKTQQFIGIILPQIGPHQTSYVWNTRDLLLDRTSPLKKNVTPGTYQIRLAYDGNNVLPITSAAFTITN